MKYDKESLSDANGSKYVQLINTGYIVYGNKVTINSD